MAEPLTIPARWAITFSGSLLLWIVPVSMKAPRLAVLTSFIASIGGFSYSALVSAAWKNEARVDRRRQTLDQELEAFQFGLEEESIKQQLVAQYFPQSEAEKVPVAVKEQGALPAVKTNPAIDSFIRWLCNRAVPKASVREVQQAKIKGLEGFKSHDIYELFSQAAQAGHGVCDDGVFYHKSLLVG